MKKQSDPWDDSALLNAFDDALTKYKKMHKKEKPRSTQEEENTQIDELLPSSDDADADAISSKQVENVNDASFVEENHQTDSSSQEPYQQTSDGVHMQKILGVDEYNELLKQYYELEEQRQTVLQQLQQSGYMNYQYPGEVSGPSGQWGTCSVQEHQNFDQQASHPTVGSYCCPCVCPCLVTPCSSIPVCSSGVYSVGKKDIESTATACTKVHERFSSHEDDAIVKTAMQAAQQAISSTSLNASSTCNRHEGSSEGQVAHNVSPETDISVVLNAWYSAGFYTGKYLSEQSASKGRHG